MIMTPQLMLGSALRVRRSHFSLKKYGISLNWEYKPHFDYIGQSKELQMQ